MTMLSLVTVHCTNSASKKKEMLSYDLLSCTVELAKKTLLIFVCALVMAVSLPVSAKIAADDVQMYYQAMNSAANTKNIDDVSKLIANNAIIAINRNGVAGTMNKQTYLQKLQENWRYSENYRYSMKIRDIVPMGGKTKVKIVTTETYSKDAQPIKQITKATVTLSSYQDKIVLLKAVSEISFK